MASSNHGESSSGRDSHRRDSVSSVSTASDVDEDQEHSHKHNRYHKSKSKSQIARHRSNTLDEHGAPQMPQLVRHETRLLGGRLRLRAKEDEDPSDWWFASTAIPLLAATFAPMANLMSIAALVVSWRNNVTTDDPATRESSSDPFPDPTWCLGLNGASLACGFIGNLFLLFNFTKKVRYIIALPVTIFLFYMASAILIGIITSMEIYVPPTETQVYSQGFWYAVLAAVLYMLNGMLLMVNMLGYFLGHYPQHFDLTDEQRNLILQTMIFFIWLGGGAGVMARLEGWSYPDALYFCDVTLLTIGFGDLVPHDDPGRGIVFPFSVGGTIILGLMVSSIHKFAQELSKEKVVRKHVETRRVNTLSRAVTLEEHHAQNGAELDLRKHLSRISRPMEAAQIQKDLDEKARAKQAGDRTIGFVDPATKEDNTEPSPGQFRFRKGSGTGSSRVSVRNLTMPMQLMVRRVPTLIPSRTQKAIIMNSEKDRFDKMRDIQFEAARFKQWYAVMMSVISFGMLWCLGAVVFFYAEANTQNLSYFQSLYFCYVSLLTIGYGDLSPRSNAGKPFFVLWSLIAVPTMTILVSDLGDTVIGGFKRRVLKYGGLAFLGKGRGWGLDWFVHKYTRRPSLALISNEKASALETGASPASGDGSDGDDDLNNPKNQRAKTIEELADEDLSETQMLRNLAFSIRRVADDLKTNSRKRYGYEDWVEFTRLIRFTRLDRLALKDCNTDAVDRLQRDEAVDGVVEWDWLDHNSPMASDQTEAEWILDRLLESLLRVFHKQDLMSAIGVADVVTGLSSPSHAAHHSHHKETHPTSPDHHHPHPHLHPRRPSIATSSSGPGRVSHDRRMSVEIAKQIVASDPTSTSTSTEEPTWSKRGKARITKANQTAAVTGKRRSTTTKHKVGTGRTRHRRFEHTEGVGMRTLKAQHLDPGDASRIPGDSP